MQTYHYSIMGQVYGGGAYDTSSYGTAAANASTSAGGSGLTNTGVAIAGIVTIAAVILLAAIVVRIWKRPRRAALEPAQINDSPESTDNDPQDGVSR